MDTKYKVFFVCMITILLLEIYLVVIFNPNNTIRKPYERIVEELRKDNEMLLQNALRHDEEVRRYRAEVDSLEIVKQKKESIYVRKYKEIDAASTNALVVEFKSIFAENGIN